MGTAESSACVYGCVGVGVHLLAGAHLYHLAEVHDGDSIGDVPHEREVVRDEQVGEIELALERLEEVDDLRANRHVESRHRLVEDEQLWIERERARNTDPLSLAAGELVREPVPVLGRESDRAQQLVHARAPLASAIEAVDA